MNQPSEKETRKRAAQAESSEQEKMDRRTWVRRGVKAAYVVPAVLAAIKGVRDVGVTNRRFFLLGAVS